jgi:hypothetical protein
MVAPGDGKAMGPDTETGAGDYRWLQFGKYIWRVLHVYSYEGQKHALLLAEEPVAIREFDSVNNDWKTSGIRDWLNNDFYRRAFNEGEKSTIVTRTYRYGGSNEGSDKEDTSKIFLLSYDEAENKEYFTDDASRVVHRYDYFRRGSERGSQKVSWWLRSPGSSNDRAALVYSDGYVSGHHYDNDVFRMCSARMPSAPL